MGPIKVITGLGPGRISPCGEAGRGEKCANDLIPSDVLAMMKDQVDSLPELVNMILEVRGAHMPDQRYSLGPRSREKRKKRFIR